MSSAVLDIRPTAARSTAGRALAGPSPAERSTAGHSHARGAPRLTRRGRLVILSTVVLTSLAIFAERGSPADSSTVVHHPHLATVVVTRGETVWDIARTVSGGSDPRQVVAEIEQLNSLPDAGSIRVGQPLFVPAR